MKIVILDGYTINPGDLDWKPIEAFGELTYYDRTEPEDTYERSKDADLIITSKVVINRELFEKLPKLRYIGVIATGYNDVVDMDEARKRNIPVTNIPDYCTSSVAQMVFALILELARRTGDHDCSVKAGNWFKSPDFSYWDHPQMDLTEKVLGLIGFGAIGKLVARIAKPFGMQVIAYDKYPHPPGDIKMRFVDLDVVFHESDIVSLHCPTTPETRGIINTANLAKMKKTAFVVNTGRGPLVTDTDLAEALNTGVIAGAALDVMSSEPPLPDNPLLLAKNCIITPHIAWASREARQRLIRLAAENIQAFLDGCPVNVVN